MLPNALCWARHLNARSYRMSTSCTNVVEFFHINVQMQSGCSLDCESTFWEVSVGVGWRALQAKSSKNERSTSSVEARYRSSRHV